MPAKRGAKRKRQGSDDGLTLGARKQKKTSEEVVNEESATSSSQGRAKSARKSRKSGSKKEGGKAKEKAPVREEKKRTRKTVKKMSEDKVECKTEPSLDNSPKKKGNLKPSLDNSPKKKGNLKVTSTSGKQNKFVGAHTSISGGLENAVYEAVDIGARAFGLFLKSQRQWNCKPLEDKSAEKFKEACKEHNFAPHLIVPHGSYLMNCGSPEEETLRKSRDALTDELQRCEKLGLVLFNFHPGSTCGKITVEECIKRIAKSINQAVAKTKYVIAVVENMSCQGNTIGGKFSELRDIIVGVKDKSRVGVCLDTCHAFAAGYNLATEDGYNEMMTEFENVVGLKYLKAVHVNDSKGEVGCHLDRHENIGRGKIGLDGFRRIMNDSRFNNIPFVLETPQNDYSKEIKKLYSLCK